MSEYRGLEKSGQENSGKRWKNSERFLAPTFRIFQPPVIAPALVERKLGNYRKTWKFFTFLV